MRMRRRTIAPLWLNGNQPTPQATAIVVLLQNSLHKGLNPDDYDAGHWQARVDGLKTANDPALAEFDAAMTVGLMRYISDLHIGRVNPASILISGSTSKRRSMIMPQFVTQDVQHAVDVQAVLDSGGADRITATSERESHCSTISSSLRRGMGRWCRM